MSLQIKIHVQQDITSVEYLTRYTEPNLLVKNERCDNVGFVLLCESTWARHKRLNQLLFPLALQFSLKKKNSTIIYTPESQRSGNRVWRMSTLHLLHAPRWIMRHEWFLPYTLLVLNEIWPGARVHYSCKLCKIRLLPELGCLDWQHFHFILIHVKVFNCCHPAL